ncbi:transposase, partial [Lapidilactobacillus achengensis]
PETKKLLWGGHLWAPSYYMGTLGNMSKETVANYIQNQRTERGKAGRPSKLTSVSKCRLSSSD